MSVIKYSDQGYRVEKLSQDSITLRRYRYEAFIDDAYWDDGSETFHEDRTFTVKLGDWYKGDIITVKQFKDFIVPEFDPEVDSLMGGWYTTRVQNVSYREEVVIIPD